MVYSCNKSLYIYIKGKKALYILIFKSFLGTLWNEKNKIKLVYMEYACGTNRE